MEYVTHSRAETETLGARLAERLPAGAVVAFTGDLGAGKTAFVSGMEGADELFHIGWEDYLGRGGVCAVEWSENVAEAIEPGTVRVDIRRGAGDDDRVVTIEGM